MKKMFIGVCLGMASGIALTSYVLSNPDTRRCANKMMMEAMDSATTAMNDMKSNMKKK